MKRIIPLLTVSILFSINLAASNGGAELFSQKCGSCHTIDSPKDRSKAVAPPARGIMFHMSEAFSNNKDIKNHIMDFVINPTKDKAICWSVKRFGLMPSQKGLVTDKELDIISDWMINNLSMTKEEHDGRQNKHRGH